MEENIVFFPEVGHSPESKQQFVGETLCGRQINFLVVGTRGPGTATRESHASTEGTINPFVVT